MNTPRRWPAALALAAALAAPQATLAADALTDAIQAAYPPYRAALFRTNGTSQADAASALQQARQAWADVVARHAKSPPPPYDRDTAVAATLAEVTAVYEHAAVQVEAGKLAKAHDTLERARDLLADLRRRNGVVVYSDHMNAYHEEMEHVVIEGPQQLATPQGAQALLARVGALEYLAQRLRSEAPAGLQANAEFTALQQQVQASVVAAREALVRQDVTAAREALARIKKPYSQLFMKFG